jgi:hypothetical protein
MASIAARQHVVHLCTPTRVVVQYIPHAISCLAPATPIPSHGTVCIRSVCRLPFRRSESESDNFGYGYARLVGSSVVAWAKRRQADTHLLYGRDGHVADSPSSSHGTG